MTNIRVTKLDQWIENAKATIEFEGLTVKKEYIELVKQRQSGIITKEEFLKRLREIIG